MAKFPVDAPKRKVVKALKILGFQPVREKEHISMMRENPDGIKTPMTMPNHPKNKSLYTKNNLHPIRNYKRRVFGGLQKSINLTIADNTQFEAAPETHVSEALRLF